MHGLMLLMMLTTVVAVAVVLALVYLQDLLTCTARTVLIKSNQHYRVSDTLCMLEKYKMMTAY